jgi:hypothetical protein
VVVLAHAAACGGSGDGDDDDDSGDFVAALSDLNGIWSLSGDFGFLCDGNPINQRLTGGKVYVLDGQFDEPAIPLPTAVCNVATVKFAGAFALDGSLSGNFSVNNSTLVDTFGGTCESDAACSGGTQNTGLLSFTLAATGDNVFDGAWSFSYACSDGTTPSSLFAGLGNVTIAGGVLSSAGMMNTGCQESGLLTYGAPQSATLSGTVSATGAVAATLTQPTGETVTFTATSSSATAIAGTGNLGTTMSLTRPTP